MEYPSGECKCCDENADIIKQLRTENDALKADNELLRSLSFRDERDALKEQVAHVKEVEFPRKCETVASGWRTKVEQQAAVIEQMREALELWRLASDNAEESELDDMSCYCVPMPLFCDAEEATQLALALHPSPEILEARDQRVAEACANLLDHYGLTTAALKVRGEWNEYL